MLTFAVFVLGLLFGSFANAAVWRLKVKKPLGKDRSECPNCHHKLGVADLVPVFSWLWLRGRCRYCKKPISVQYPVVELLTAILFEWSYLAWDFSHFFSYLSFGGWLLILVGLVILAVYDLKWLEIPEKVLRLLVALQTGVLIASVIISQSFDYVGTRLVAAVFGFLFFYGLYAFGKGRWMGGGDVKLAFLMGLLLGVSNLLIAFFLAFNIAAIVSLVLMAAKKLRRKSLIPFGPFLITGTVIALLHGQQLLNLYIDFFINY